MNLEVTHKYIELEQLTLHYVETCERENKPTVVFLHGFPECWLGWKNQLERLGKHYHCVVPDLPGYNRSDKPRNQEFYQIHNLIAVMAEFIRRTSNDQPVILVAHDWGGAIAWPLAAFKPELIAGLVILNAAHPSTFTREMISNPIQQQKSQYIHDLIGNDAVNFVTQQNFSFLINMLQQSRAIGELSNNEVNNYIATWRQPKAIESMLKYYQMMPQLAPKSGTDVASKPVHVTDANVDDSPVKDVSAMKIPKIFVKVPTLVLWGEQDQAFVPALLDGLDEYVPNLTITRFPRASHWLHHEQPEQVSESISAFVDNCNDISHTHS